MRLGIDLGTTRTVVAVEDRGNFPVVSFTDDAGDACDWFPSVVAERDCELRFGFDAVAVAGQPGWTLVRSFKRHASELERLVRVGTMALPVGELLTRFLGALREAILTRSNLPKRLTKDGVLEAVLSVPANAPGTQRFLTIDAFRRAGIGVRSLLNEPSAAGFEYSHRHRATLTSRREHVVVYDLGGGTFDASLVRMTEGHHDVVATAGISRLGGDDFDDVLLDLLLAKAGVARASLDESQLTLLAEQCRGVKERLHPSTRKIAVELEGGLGEATIPASEFYEAAAFLVERTIDAMAPILTRLDDDEARAAVPDDVAGIYVVGGASSLPLVGRMLRDRFGRRVHRSPYPSAATAIGLAIAGSETAGYALTDRFSRVFGVFREAEDGRVASFDPIFGRDVAVPHAGERETVVRAYQAAHNVGHYRFLECPAVADDGSPRGEITPLADALFPFDPALRDDGADLRAVPVRRMPAGGPHVEERYAIDEHGLVEITIRDVGSGYERSYRVGA